MEGGRYFHYDKKVKVKRPFYFTDSREGVNFVSNSQDVILG